MSAVAAEEVNTFDPDSNPLESERSPVVSDVSGSLLVAARALNNMLPLMMDLLGLEVMKYTLGLERNKYVI
jgi:hypothetical protein